MAEHVFKSFEIPWNLYQGLIDKEYELRSSAADILDKDSVVRWGRMEPLDEEILLRWIEAEGLDKEVVLRWMKAERADADKILRWQKTLEIDPDKVLRWQKTAEIDPNIEIPWAQVGQVDVEKLLRWGTTAYVDVDYWIRWAKSAAIDVESLLRWSKTKAIDVSTFFRYIRNPGVIIVEPEITVVTEYGDNVPILSGSIKTSMDSWLWQFTAELPSRAAAKLVDPNEYGGTPVELTFTLNGYVWKFIVERISESYQYGEGGYSLYGRSVAAVLDEPYAPKVTKTYDSLTTAKTIASAETFAAGWDIDWETADFWDWNIPADVFSVTDATTAKILSAIVKSTGGMFRAHPSTKTLEFMYRFLSDPAQWEIDDPDDVLHTGIILNQSIEADPAPLYNYVIVGGKNDGVIVHVKRTGTSADIPAPPVTDELVTVVNTGRQKGRDILYENGQNRIKSRIDLPLPAATSGISPMLLLPGHVVQVDDLFDNHFRGQVRSTDIKFALASVTMSVEVLRFI